MGIYAIVESGCVTDTVIWDGKTNWSPATGDAVLIDENVSIGWKYDGNKFTEPTLPEMTSEEKARDAELQKEARILQAKNEIIIWQTKLLMGRKLSTNDIASLNLWMDYIDDLNEVNLSNPDKIKWPVHP